MSRVKILLAEDDTDHKRLLLLALVRGRSRVDVTVVARGGEFLDAIKRDHFDCAILDYNLPDYNASELLGVARPHLAGCPTLIVSSSDDQRVVINAMRSGGVDFLPKMEAIQGQILWERVEASILSSRHEERDRRRSERRERRLARASETDHLTGLYNRRYLDRCIDEAVWAKDRRGTHGVAMIDVDHFKSINDTYGHAAGDEVLRGLAQVIRESLQGGDTAIRYGGEEFLIVRPSINLSDMWLWAEKLKQQVATHLVGDQQSIQFSVSIGIAAARRTEIGSQIIEQADRALYMAKDLGRNQVCNWDRVWIDEQLELSAAASNQSLSERLEGFITRIEPRLGPTQHDHLTSHAVSVHDTATLIARRVGVDADLIQDIQEAALLHDVGKCLIPESLLAKPRSLAIDEWRLVALHTDWSAWIATRLGAAPRVAEMVLRHHDRFDARHGCSEQDIAGSDTFVGAQIICVADALVTMMTDRPYRRGKSIGDALAELNRERGRQFHPVAVDSATTLEPAALAA